MKRFVANGYEISADEQEILFIDRGIWGLQWLMITMGLPAALLVVLGGLVLYLYGKEYFKVLLFPIIFLIFMVPLPAIVYQAIAFKLQLFVSIVSAKLIAFAGVAVYRSGNIIEALFGKLL